MKMIADGKNPLQPEDNTDTTGRMLAEGDGNLAWDVTSDTNAPSLNAGQDAQLDATLLEDVTEIDQTDDSKAQEETIKAVTLEDQGNQGVDTNTDDMDHGSGSSTGFMTWVMYIGGAILVMALIAGACYLLMQNKDASDFEHENTEMTMQ